MPTYELWGDTLQFVAVDRRAEGMPGEGKSLGTGAKTGVSEQ